MATRKKKPLWIRNNIVFDPNLDYDPFDDDSLMNKKKYLKGKIKRKRYFGI